MQILEIKPENLPLSPDKYKPRIFKAAILGSHTSTPSILWHAIPVSMTSISRKVWDCWKKKTKPFKKEENNLILFQNVEPILNYRNITLMKNQLCLQVQRINETWTWPQKIQNGRWKS